MALLIAASTFGLGRRRTVLIKDVIYAVSVSLFKDYYLRMNTSFLSVHETIRMFLQHF